MLGRRHFLALAARSLPVPLTASNESFNNLPRAFAGLERANGGRLGVAVIDTATGKRVGHRADERFPMCSTFKFLLAAAVLERVDRKLELLERAIRVPSSGLLAHSPLSEPHAGGLMSVGAMCHAVIVQSDNTAANLLLETIGGPPGWTRFARSLGDAVTRLDRTEPAMNESAVGDPRDTTSPSAMAADLRSLLLGDVLTPSSRNQLTAWMEACETGLDRLRAKLPAGWRAADKTGRDGEHTSNDIAVLWPGNRPPVVVAAYVNRCFGEESKRAAMLAEIGRLVSEALT